MSNTSTTHSNNTNQENTYMSATTTTSIDAADVKTAEQITHEAVRALLGQLAGQTATSESAIARHQTPKNKVSIPVDMSTAKAAEITTEAAEAERAEQEFTKEFKANPWDGAVAFQSVLGQVFGSMGRAVPIQTMFGPIHPETLDIIVGYDENGKEETVQATWGRFKFAPLEGQIDLSVGHHPDYGQVFRVEILCPKKYAAQVAGLWKLIDQELAENSIYKGKAVRITGNDRPRFIDLSVEQVVVYNEDVYARLDDAIWSNLRHTELLRSDRESKIDPTVLLFGPYGTGKSVCGHLTARHAVNNGWTFIQFDSGKGTRENLRQTLQMAKLFAPAVVFIEDIDIYMDAEGAARSQLLEMFDGLSAKGSEVLIVMTSNKVDELDKGMSRPGRIDDMIEIGKLNREATEKLIRLVNGAQLAEDVDFDKIYEAVKDFEPAFIRRTFVKARQRAMVRTADELKAQGQYTPRKAKNFTLATDDFVQAAHIMGQQHAKHEAASDQGSEATIDTMVAKVVTQVLANDVRLSNDRFGSIDVHVLEDAEKD